MKNRTLLFVCSILCLTACHSADWQPPESQQAPAASAAAPEPAPATSAAPADSASAPVAATNESAAPSAPAAEAAPSAAPTEATSAPGAGKGATKSEHKEAHKSEEPAAGGSDAYAGPDPCEGKTFHYGLIAATCKKSGRKGVKEIMKGAVKKAKAAGQDIQCTSCHEDTKSFHLKSNAVSDLKQWL